MNYNIDLHIHTVLSPCADLLMTPGNIIKKAEEIGLDIIALTDHNSAENIEVALKLAKDSSVEIIPGMEVETAEEVHLLTYFPTLEQILDWQQIVYENLPERENNEEFFGYQIKTDINDKYIKKVNRLLATAVNLNVSQVVEKVRRMGGVVVPSHLDRSYSLIKNLGFIPPGLELSLVEISRNGNIKKMIKKFPYLKNYIFVQNSDSHYLDEMKVMMEIYLEKYSFERLFLNLINNRIILK